MQFKLKVHNNLSGKKEDFKPLEEGKVRFYSCGPTTYDLAHVGNARAFVVGDLFNRIMRSLGYDVTFVRNFTDVDDKIIQRANELGVDALEHSQKYIDECLTDMGSLGMKLPDHTPKVSTTMDEIIKMIEELIANETAYVVEGEVLYHVPKFKEYGKLSKKKLEDLEHGIRVEVDSKKKHPSDFVLWKPAKEGEPSWDSPWGKGRPGWHIECSAMARKYLGKSIDLHHGGVDLIFPHHENEIAQSEAANNQQFCGHWCHNEFLNFGDEKMSKSLGNVITIRDFTAKFSGAVLRQILSSVHYRSKMEWNQEVIERAINDLERIHQFAHDVETLECKSANSGTKLTDVISEMKKELSNDFNVPGAVSHLFGMIRDIRRDYLDKNNLTEDVKKHSLEVLDFVKESLGMVYDNPTEILSDLNKAKKALHGDDGQGLSDSEIENLIVERNQARSEKNWARADEIRDIFKANKITLLDRPDGTTTWKYE